MMKISSTDDKSLSPKVPCVCSHLDGLSHSLQSTEIMIAYSQFDKAINADERHYQTAKETVIADPIGKELRGYLPHCKDNYNHRNYYPQREQIPSIGASYCV